MLSKQSNLKMENFCTDNSQGKIYRHTKRCLMSYVIKESQIKTMRYYSTPIMIWGKKSKIPATPNVDNNIVIGIFIHYNSENTMIQSHWKKIWQFRRKPNILLSCEIAIVILQMNWKLTFIQKLHTNVSLYHLYS